MKTTFRLTCLVLLAFILAACSGKAPDNVAVDFSRALYTGDSDKAITYCTDDTKPMVGMIMGMAASKVEQMKESDPKIKVLESAVSEDGNSATTVLEIKDYFDFSKGEISEEAQEETVHMKKIDGKWKVALTK